jgi:methylglutaconyl-CoA hydratase
MSAGFIETTVQNAVGTITLNRVDLHNAFNDEMIKEIEAAFNEMGQNPAVRVVILQANGKSFCAGADLNWMKRMIDYSFEENVVDALGLARMLKTIHDCPKPVIARVHGAAFGGGVGLISACDFAVSVESAGFALTEVKLGLLPAVISPFVLKKIPASAAQRYFLTAEKFDAREAHRIGLLSDVVPDETALDQWITDRISA